MSFNNAGYVQNDGPFPSSRRMDPINNMTMYSQSGNNSKSSGRLNSLGGSNFHLPTLGKKKKNRNVDDDDDYLGVRAPRGGASAEDDYDDEKDTNIPENSDVRQMNFSDLSHLKDRGRYGGFDAMDTAPVIPVLDISSSGHGGSSNGMSSAQYRKQKTMQKKQMFNNMSNMNSYQHNHNLLNPIGAEDYIDGPRSMSLAGNQPRNVAPANNFQQQGPRSMSFTNNPMQQYPNQNYNGMPAQQGHQQTYPNDPRAMSLQNSNYQSRNQSMVNNQNPMMNGQNPMMQNGRNQSMMNGQNPMMQNGRNQSMMNGQNPMMQNGRNQSMMNGQNPMIQNGRNQSMMNGQNPMMQNGRNQSMMNGQNPMMQNGRNQSMMNGQNPMMQNGRNQSMRNGQNPMMQNGRNQSMMNGQNPMMQNGRNQSMMNGQNPMMPNGRNQSLMNGQNPMMQNGRNQSLMNGQNPMNNYKNNRSQGDLLAHSHNNGNINTLSESVIPPSPPPPPTKSELDRLKGTPKKSNSNSPARYRSESPSMYRSANGNTPTRDNPSNFAINNSPSPMKFNSSSSKTPHKSPMRYNYMEERHVQKDGPHSNKKSKGIPSSSSKTNTPSKYESLEFGNPYSIRDSALSNNDLFNDIVRDEEDKESYQTDNDDKNLAGKMVNAKSDYYNNYDNNNSKPISGKSLDFNKSHGNMPKKSLFSTSDDDSVNSNSAVNIPSISENINKEEQTFGMQSDHSSKKNKFRFNDTDSDNEDEAIGLQPPPAPNMRRKPPPTDSSDVSSSDSLNNTQLKNKNSKNNFMAKLEASIDDTSVLNNDRNNNNMLNVDKSSNEYSNRISRSNYKTLMSPDEDQITKGFFNRRKSSSFGDDDSTTNKRDSKRASSRGSITAGAGVNSFFKKLGLKKKNSITESSRKKKGSELDDLNSTSPASNAKKIEDSFDESLELSNNIDKNVNHYDSRYANEGKRLSSMNQKSETSTDKYGYKLSNAGSGDLHSNIYDDDDFNLTTKYGFDKPSSSNHLKNRENNEKTSENFSHIDKYGYKLSSDAVKSREGLLNGDFKDSNSSFNFYSTENHVHSLDPQSYEKDFAKASTNFGEYMNSMLSDISSQVDQSDLDVSKKGGEDDRLGFATAKAEVAKEMKSDLRQADYGVRSNFVPLDKKLNFTAEQLGILNANKSLMNELQLMTKELTDSVQREIKLDGELRRFRLGKGDDLSNNDEFKFETLQDEMRSKVLEQSKMVDDLNRERKLRQLAEERVIALEGGKSDLIPTNLEMNYKITDLQTQLLEYQDKISQQEEIIAKHDIEKNSLKEDNLQLEIELQKFKNDTVPNLVNEIEILKKSDIKNYQKAQEQLNLYKQEIQNLKMKLIGNSKNDGSRIENNNETENQRDALREALKNLRESKDKEIRHGKERIQQLERRVTKLSELNEKLQQKLLG